MALIKLSNNGVKNITSVGSIGTGDLVFISKQTASSSASISFTSGIDSTYKEYVFYFVNIHPATDTAKFTFQGNAVGGSGYNETITSTFFYAYHDEADSEQGVSYYGGGDQAQGTSFQRLSSGGVGNGNDESVSGYFHLFNPSNTTFVKHFVSSNSTYQDNNSVNNNYVSGYFNTTSAIDEIQFKFDSGNIDSGDILLYGVN